MADRLKPNAIGPTAHRMDKTCCGDAYDAFENQKALFDLPFCLYCRMFLKLLPIPIAGIHEACCCNSYHLYLLFRFVMNEEWSSDPRYLLTKMRDLKTKMQVVLTSPLFEGEDISSREIADAIFDKVSTY